MNKDSQILLMFQMFQNLVLVQSIVHGLLFQLYNLLGDGVDALQPRTLRKGEKHATESAGSCSDIGNDMLIERAYSKGASIYHVVR